ncbi:uncharacterized protein [Anolis sagrei]|uniref:uncharacterized protein n=1 Tax=Anolis sagrei TaxID=38937 RepID=UPI003520F7E0
MSALSFKKCSACGVNLPEADRHNKCLLCLGEAHNRSACEICRAFTSRAQKSRDSRLKALLYEQALAPEETRQAAQSLSQQPSPSPLSGERPGSSTQLEENLAAGTPPPGDEPPPKRPRASKQVAHKSKSKEKQNKKKGRQLSGLQPLSPPTLAPPAQLLELSPTEQTAQLLELQEPPELLPIELLDSQTEPNLPPSPSLQPAQPPREHPPSPVPAPPTSQAERGRSRPSRSRRRSRSSSSSHSRSRSHTPPPKRSRGRDPRDRDPRFPSPYEYPFPLYPPPPFYYPYYQGEYSRDHTPPPHPYPHSYPPPSATISRPPPEPPILQHQGAPPPDPATPQQDLHPDPDMVDAESSNDSPPTAALQTEPDPDPLQAEEFKNFSALLIRLSRSLNLAVPQPTKAVDDPCFTSSEQQRPMSTILPTLPYLLEVLKTEGVSPALVPATPKRAENLYRIDLTAASWLAKLPRANSVVTDAQPKPVQRNQASPSDKEGKKLDAMAKKFYSSACLFARMAHYGVYMSVYQTHLWNKILPYLDLLPMADQPMAKAFAQEALLLSKLQKDLAKNTADTSGKLIAGAVALRRHAWLRASTLSPSARTLIEDLPMDQTGLFNPETDSQLKHSHEMKQTVTKYDQQPYQQRQRWGNYYHYPTYQRGRYNPHSYRGKQRPHSSPATTGKPPVPFKGQYRGTKPPDNKKRRF